MVETVLIHFLKWVAMSKPPGPRGTCAGPLGSSNPPVDYSPGEAICQPEGPRYRARAGPPPPRSRMRPGALQGKRRASSWTQGRIRAAAGPPVVAPRRVPPKHHRTITEHTRPVMSLGRPSAYIVLDMSTSETILVVEDDRDMAGVVAMNLRDLGYRTDVAHDGRTGLRKAQEGSYALVILDIMLPQIDGLTVCRRIREVNPSTPILMLTARSEELDRVL